MTAAVPRIAKVVAVPDTTRWQLRLLDGFALVDGSGVAVEVPSSAQHLVAFLAVHDRPVQRSFVAGTLWPDTSDLRAGACLRSALWRLGTSCPKVVRTTATCIGLECGVGVDVRELTATTHDLRRGRIPAEAYRLVERFECDLLADWYDDWVAIWRERWRQTRLHALESLATVLAGAGVFDVAIEAGLAAVRADPLRESAHRVLIEAHLLEGNRCEALRQFRAYEALMRAQLGLAPSATIVALIERATAC